MRLGMTGARLFSCFTSTKQYVQERQGDPHEKFRRGVELNGSHASSRARKKGPAWSRNERVSEVQKGEQMQEEGMESG